MRLKAIELKGFKSFAQRTRIEFPPGISAIVGPNGCGKSNIIDAVRWVLGEQATGTLRAKRMEDVIFSGTEHRVRQNYAEVSLFFEDAEKMTGGASETLVIRRILHRSGESIYSIDDKDVRLRDVRELLMDTGIGVSGYSLVSQGDIEDILSESSFNRRRIFEEASGISLLTAKKLEASRRLRRVESNVERISDIYVEVQARVEPLRQSAEKAAAYLALKEQMEDAQLFYALRDYERYDKEAKEWQHQLLSMRRKEEKLGEELAEREEKNIALEKVLLELEEEHDALRTRQRDLMETRDALFLELRLKEERKAQGNVQDRVMVEGVEKGETHQIASQENIKNLLREVEEKERLHGELFERAQVLQSELLKKSDLLTSSSKSLEEREEKIRTLREQIEASNATERLLHEQKITLERSLDGLDFDKLEVKEKEEASLKKQQEEETSLTEILRLFAKATHAQNETRREKEEMQESLQELRSERLIKEGQLSALQKERGLLEELEARQLEGEGDVKDLFLDHIRVDRGYEKAVEAVLGNKLRAILRRDKEEALSEAKGRGSYLLYGATQEAATQSTERALLPHVHAKKEYQPLLAALLGHVQLVGSLAEVPADPLTTYVTKGGQLLSGPLLNLSSEEQLDLLSFRARREEILEELRGLEGALEENERSIERHVREVERWSDRLTMEEEKTAQLEMAKSEAQEKIRVLQHEQDLLRQHMQQREEQTQQEKERLSTLAQSLDETLRLRKELRQSLEALREQPMEQANHLEEETRGDEARLHALELELARSEEVLRAVRTKLDDMRATQTREEERLLHERQSLAVLRKTQESLQSEIDSLREEHSQSLLAIEAFDQHVMGLRKQMGERRMRKEAEEKERREIERKRMELLQEISSLDVRYVRSDERRKGISEDVWDHYSLSILQLRERFRDTEVTTSRSELRAIRQSMLAMEPVNLEAIEEHKQVAEREMFLRTQFEDLQKAREDLLRTLASLERRMRVDFKETFEEIRGYFQDIFRELFRGGEGDIRLEMDKDILESDILIYASPPGKKLVHMNLLSGGEKAMTSIALLFAVLRAKPSPFYILDEVEAALDDINIQRFGDFLLTFSGGSQFILITHRKGTMEYAKALYGVSMEEKGISTLVSLDLTKGGAHGRAV